MNIVDTQASEDTVINVNDKDHLRVNKETWIDCTRRESLPFQFALKVKEPIARSLANTIERFS